MKKFLTKRGGGAGDPEAVRTPPGGGSGERERKLGNLGLGERYTLSSNREIVKKRHFTEYGWMIEVGGASNRQKELEELGSISNVQSLIPKQLTEEGIERVLDAQTKKLKQRKSR